MPITSRVKLWFVTRMEKDYWENGGNSWFIRKAWMILRPFLKGA